LLARAGATASGAAPGSRPTGHGTAGPRAVGCRPGPWQMRLACDCGLQGGGAPPDDGCEWRRPWVRPPRGRSTAALRGAGPADQGRRESLLHRPCTLRPAASTPGAPRQSSRAQRAPTARDGVARMSPAVVRPMRVLRLCRSLFPALLICSYNSEHEGVLVITQRTLRAGVFVASTQMISLRYSMK
jgi:hypothetical protein